MNNKRYTIYGNADDLEGIQEGIDLVKENERLKNDNHNLKLIIATAIRIYEKCEETQDYSTCDLDMYEVLKGVYKSENI